jgi:putative DNA primase/helicase
MIAWAQPDPTVRRYLHQVAGYACSGHTGEHKLWFNYGRGRNGKSGDRQLVQRAGRLFGHDRNRILPGPGRSRNAATPRPRTWPSWAASDAARVRTRTRGQAERALIKGDRRRADVGAGAASRLLSTSAALQAADERQFEAVDPRHRRRHLDPHEAGPVAAQHRPARSRPVRDPVPEWPPGAWPKKDTKLLDKIKATELPGVFRAWSTAWSTIWSTASSNPKRHPGDRRLSRRTVRPAGPLPGALHRSRPKSRVKSSELHDVYAAWCKAAGEKEWTPRRAFPTR